MHNQCPCNGSDLRGVKLIPRLENRETILYCEQCGRRLCQEATLESHELTRRGACRVLVEAQEATQAANGRTPDEEAKRVEAFLGHGELAVPEPGPLTKDQEVQVALSGLEVPMQDVMPAPVQHPPRRLCEEEVQGNAQRRAGATASVKYAVETQLNAALHLSLLRQFRGSVIKAFSFDHEAVTVEVLSDVGLRVLKIPYTVAPDGEIVLDEPALVVGEEAARLRAVHTDVRLAFRSYVPVAA